MKNIIGLFISGLILASSASVSLAQWTTSGNDIYYSSGNVGIGTSSPAELLHINGNIRGNQAGAIRIQTPTGYTIVGSRNSGWSHFHTDRPRFYFNKEIRVDQGLIGSYNESLKLSTEGNVRLTIDKTTGNVGIGTTSPEEKLTVAGKGKFQEIIVEETTGADFVFEENYNLPTLSDIETFIKSNRHLPKIPTAERMKREGVKVGELQIKLLQKIEELTLYLIELNKQNQILQKDNADMKIELSRIKNVLGDKNQQ